MTLNQVGITIFLEVVRVLIIMLYFNIFFELQNKKIHIITGGLSLLITTSCYLLFNISLVNLVATIVGIFVISLGFKGRIGKKLLLSIMCYSLMFAIDIVAIFIHFNNANSDQYIVVSSFISVISFYMVVLTIRILFRKKLKTEVSGQWYILLIVSIISIFLLNIIWTELSSNTIVIVGICILLINFLLYIFYFSMLDRFIYKQENIELKQQMNLYEQQIRANVESDMKIRLIRHDIKHHIREIRELASNNKIQEIKEYADNLSQDIDVDKVFYKTGNVALDGILNYYMSKFNENNIKTDINVTVPENIGVTAYDINIILGNLLDNVVENTVRASEPSMFMDLRYSKGSLNILIDNTYDGKLNENNGEILSLKQGEHGFGIKNITRIVKKYGGDVLITHDDNIFSVGIIMYV